MAQNDRRGNVCAALATLIDMYVRTADTASADAQQHLTFTGLGEVQGTDFDFLISEKICANHCCNLRIVYVKRFVMPGSNTSQSQAGLKMQQKMPQSCT